MVHLSISNCYTLIVFDNDDEANTLALKIRGLVTYSPSKAFYAQSNWGKRDVCLMHERGSKISFPTGYLSQLVNLLRDNNIEIDWRDNRPPPDFFYNYIPLNGLQLRPHQVSGVGIGLQTHRAIFSWPTGSGKTELLIALAHTIGRRTLWLTSSVNVLSQTNRRIQQRIGNGHDITVTLPENVKTLSSLAYYDVLIIDECHHTEAKTWYNVAMKCQAPYRFAVSATPFDTPDGNLKLRAAVTCDNIHTVTYQELYNSHYLSRPTVRLVKYVTENLKGVKTRVVGHKRTTVWHDVYEKGVALNDDRNRVAMSEIAHYLRHGIRPLVICRLKDKHAVPMMWHCIHAGWVTEVVTGDSSDAERLEAIEKLVDGKLDVLIATCILGEGQDIPDLQAVINLTAGDGVKQTLQIAGRTMRPQTPSYVSDFLDIHHKVLFRHTESRRMHYHKIQANVQEVTW